MAKSNDPRTFFLIFFGGAAGRSLVDGLWPWRSGQRKAPDIGWTAKLADGGGETAPSVWVTNPRARTFAPWWDWRTHNIHHVIIMSSESWWKSRRIHGAMRTGLPASGSATWKRSERPFLAALLPCGVFYFVTNTLLYHRLLVSKKRFTRYQEYANETKLY